MSNLNSKVDNYFANGCGRCKFGGTPHCKVNSWQKELIQLRDILLDCQLSENLKWAVPCYTYQNKNIVLMSAFKEYCAVLFFKGALLKDTRQILVKPGDNTQAGRQIRFTNVAEIVKVKPVLKSYIKEAIEVEQAGLKVITKTKSEPIPEELQHKFSSNRALKSAFYTLTPGRQRAYLLHFSAAKQSKTRLSRIEKYLPRILNGKGMYD